MLLAALRDARQPVAVGELAADWPDRGQRDRALASLLDDGLAVRLSHGRIWLPSGHVPLPHPAD